MNKLIIDPCLFEIPADMSKEDQFEHFMFLKNCIDFVADYFDINLDSYDGAPYSYNSDSPPYAPPITQSHVVRNRYSEVSKKIQKMVSLGDFVELTEQQIDDCSLQFEKESAAEMKFKQYLFCIIGSDIYRNAIILLSQKNKSCVPTVTACIDDDGFNCASLYNPAEDCSGTISDYFKSNAYHDAMFPYGMTCYKLNDCFKEVIAEKGKTSGELEAIYIKFGTEVASRNKYQRKADISRKNPRYEVFVHNQGRFFLSIDKEHGGLEMFKSHGKHPDHLGEYNFSCIQTKEADPETHKLIV